jgi:hypothetical protein
MMSTGEPTWWLATQQNLPDKLDTEVLRLTARIAQLEAVVAAGDRLAASMVSILSPFQDADFGRQMREHDERVAALADFRAAKGE